MSWGVKEYLNKLAEECSRLIQSFSYKVKGGSRQGVQFKHIKKPDEGLEMLKKYAPKIYEKYYAGK